MIYDILTLVKEEEEEEDASRRERVLKLQLHTIINVEANVTLSVT